MTLAEYITNSNEDEITVTDECFDMETYFYPFDTEEKWDKAMKKLAEMLTVKEINHGTVVVNLSDVIESKLEELKKADLFIKCSLSVIMGSMESIIAGNVSEKWFERFVNALKDNKYSSYSNFDLANMYFNQIKNTKEQTEDTEAFWNEVDKRCSKSEIEMSPLEWLEYNYSEWSNND